jgi:subtilase family serine protease
VVQFNKSLNYSVSYLPPEEKARISYDIVVPSAGTHNLVFEIDPDNQVNESIEEDNQLNISWQTF